MSSSPEALQPERDLERRRSKSRVNKGPVYDEAPDSGGGALESNAELVSSGALQRRANAALRMQVMRRVQQGVGNQHAQRLVAQLQRKPRAEAVPAGSSGAPLDQGTREVMEASLGSGFGDVRIHNDAPAAHSAEAFSADAYTTGRDIYFAAGKYAPSSHEGRHLLAHELSHTVQQSQGKVTSKGVALKGNTQVTPADDPLEAEADAAADKAVFGSPTASRDAQTVSPALALASTPAPPMATAPSSLKGRRGPEVAAAGTESRARKPQGAKAALQGEASAAGGGTPGPKAKRLPAVHGEGGVALKSAPSRHVQVPALEPPQVPAAEIAADLADPASAPQSGASAAATRGYNPDIAAGEVEGVLAEFQAGAEARKSRVRGEAARVAAEIAADGEAQKANLRGEIVANLGGMRKQVGQLRAEFTSEAEGVKLAAALSTVAGQVEASLKTANRAKGIEASAQTHKNKPPHP